MASRFAAVAAIRLDLDLDLDLDPRHPPWPLREGLPKAVPMSVGFPGVLSTARTQENGESTFQPAGLFHPSTIYITGTSIL